MDQERFEHLLAAFTFGKIGAADLEGLMKAVHSGDHDFYLKEEMLTALRSGGTDAEWTNTRENAMLADILGDHPTIEARSHRVNFIKTRWFRYAAIFLLLAGAATYIFISSPSFIKNSGVAKTNESVNPHNIQPGGNKAILTLADGSTILLDTAQNGILKTQEGITITKMQNGELEYMIAPSVDNKHTGFNTISTPRGGQYQVVLPDGSRVWLNAASSIRFPVVFKPQERRVEITGEAYFEIASNAKSSFIISAAQVEIDVLGTSFNIMAYDDEPSIKTTLLSGAVALRTGDNSIPKNLKPGQQAGFDRNKQTIEITDKIDTEETLAWKDGMLQMSGETIPSIMRQLSRWYNIEVEYPQGKPQGTLSGKIPRSMQFASVLEVLRKSGVHFKQEGTTLLIYP